MNEAAGDDSWSDGDDHDGQKCGREKLESLAVNPRNSRDGTTQICVLTSSPHWLRWEPSGGGVGIVEIH